MPLSSLFPIPGMGSSGGTLGGPNQASAGSGPATNSSVNVFGATGTLADVAQLVGLLNGPPANGGYVFNPSVAANAGIRSRETVEGNNLWWYIGGVGALVLVVLLLK